MALVEREAAKVRIDVPNDRRWHWVARALARDLAAERGERDEAFTAFMCPASPDAITSCLQTVTAKVAALVCRDRAYLDIAIPAVRDVLASVGSQLEGVLFLLREEGSTATSIMTVLYVPDTRFATALADLAGDHGNSVVVGKEAPPPPPSVDEPALQQDVQPTVMGSMWAYCPTSGFWPAGSDVLELPHAVARKVSTGDWMAIVQSDVDGEQVHAAAAVRVQWKIKGKLMTAALFDRAWYFPQPVRLDTGWSRRSLVELSISQFHSLLPEPGLSGLQGKLATLRDLRTSDVAASASIRDLKPVSRVVAALRAGCHVVLSGSAVSEKRALGISLLRTAERCGISTDVVVLTGGRQRTAQSSPDSSSSYPPDPFDYRMPRSGRSARGMDRQKSISLDEAIATAWESGTWVLVEDLSSDGADALAAGMAAVHAASTQRAALDQETSVAERGWAGTWRVIITTSLPHLEIESLLGPDISAWFSIIDIEAKPVVTADAALLKRVSAEFGLEGEGMLRQLLEIDLLDVSRTPDAILRTLRLALECWRTSIVDGIPISKTAALTYALASSPTFTQAASGEPSNKNAQEKGPDANRTP